MLNSVCVILYQFILMDKALFVMLRQVFLMLKEFLHHKTLFEVMTVTKVLLLYHFFLMVIALFLM